MRGAFTTGVQDFAFAATEKLGLAFVLGWDDIQQGYRRSKLGPFWITISMSVTALGMGVVFGALFEIPLREFLPFLAIGVMTWTFIATVLSDACSAFVSSEGIIKQIGLPFYTHIFRMVNRNFIILAHNAVIIPIVFAIFARPLDASMLLAIPGLIVLLGNLLWLSMLNAVICTRYRDLTQIVVNFLQLCFFITPIMWQPQLMIDRGRPMIVEINPFYHLIEIVRAPLLGDLPSMQNWQVAVGLLVVGWPFTLAFLGRYKRRIAYWL